MDQIQYINQSLTHLIITSQVLKRATQLLLSLYMFFFFFHSLKCHFSTLSIQFLSHSLDKNFIFLIFNGILMLIAKTSGFISLSPASDLNPAQLFKKAEDFGNALMEKELSLENSGHLEDYPLMEGESEGSNLVLEDKEEEAPNELLNNSALGGNPVTEDEESEKELDSICFFIGEEEKEKKEEDDDDEEEEVDEEEGGGGEDGLLNTDELNKKFDEFIRRMKEEIRIEAQQQLVMAY